MPGTGGGFSPAGAHVTALQTTPCSCPGASDLGLPGPLRGLLTFLGLTIFCSSASQSALSSPQVASSRSSPRWASHPARAPRTTHRLSAQVCQSSDLPAAGAAGTRLWDKDGPARVAPPCGKSNKHIYRALCPILTEIPWSFDELLNGWWGRGEFILIPVLSTRSDFTHVARSCCSKSSYLAFP